MPEQGTGSILVEPEAIARDKRERLRRFHTVRSPPLRVIGLAVFVAFGWAHQAFILPEPTLIRPLQMVTVATLIYVFASWLALVTFYDRVHRVNLGDVFLTADGLVALGTIYATGGEHSLLFFYMTLRAADQSAIGRRRTLFFGGLSVLFYLALMVGLELMPGRDVAWTVAWAKTGVIAGINLYLVGVATTADRYHRATAKAVRLSRKLIGDLEQTSSELREEKQKAQAASLAKSHFLANMSHEIRTPMNAIIGINQLQLKTELSAEAAGYARTIETSAGSLMQLIDDILDLSKVEADKLEIESVTFSISSLLEHIKELITPHAEAKGIQFILESDGDSSQWVQGDPGRVQQVLLNVVSNAVKFTDRGEVTLGVRNDNEGMIRFQVQDTGIGISAEECQKLFEPFGQATASTARRFGGTGLGLAISRHLVELMSGTIEVASMVGIGSTFAVLLPLPEAEEPDAAEAGADRVPRRSRAWPSEVLLSSDATRELSEGDPSDQPRGLDRKLDLPDARVLVADDNDVNRLVMRHQLKALGITCDLVENGIEVLEALPQRRYDLLMLDCQMPELDGYETARQIRAGETEGRLPIIAVTAHAMKGDRDRCLAVGMDDYLAKPFHEADLVEILTRWLPTRPPSPTRSVLDPSEARAAVATDTAPSETAPSDTAPSDTAPSNTAPSNTAPSDASPVIDTAIIDTAAIEALRSLQAESGDDDFLTRVVEMFQARFPVIVDDLRRHVEDSDVPAMALTAHNLKGLSGTLGAHGLMSLCIEIEEREPGDGSEGLPNLVNQIEAEALRVGEALGQLLAG